MNYIEDVEGRLSEKLPKIPHELIKLYGLLVLTTGEQTNWGNVHDAWAIWVNDITPEHKSIIEFELLSPTVQQLDEKYTVAICEVAAEIVNKKKGSR